MKPRNTARPNRRCFLGDREMNAKKIFCFIFFIFCFSFLVFEKSFAYGQPAEPAIVDDVRRMETEVARLFGYADWPLAPTKVVYHKNCNSSASYYNNGTIMFSCDIAKYRRGKSSVKENVPGETETFPGYVDYLDTVAHEVGHSFSQVFINLNDRHWDDCDAGEYLELSEGFATYVAYEILLRRSKAENDDRYERYLAARTVRYLTQLRADDHRSSSGFSSAIAFSSESERYINSSMKRFSNKEIFALKKNEDLVDSVYPRGLVRVYALKHIFTKDGFKNGTIKKYFCK
jgi:hypothetical protein